MPIYSNALTQRPANMLAYQDSMSATPRNQVLGYLADLAAASYAPQRTQQMQGLAQFLSAPPYTNARLLSVGRFHLCFPL